MSEQGNNTKEAQEHTPAQLRAQLREYLLVPFPDNNEILPRTDQLLRLARITPFLSEAISKAILIARTNRSLPSSLPSEEMHSLWSKMDRNLALTTEEAKQRNLWISTYQYLFGPGGGIFGYTTQGNKWKISLERDLYQSKVNYIAALKKEEAEGVIDISNMGRQKRYLLKQDIIREEISRQEFEKSFFKLYGESI